MALMIVFKRFLQAEKVIVDGIPDTEVSYQRNQEENHIKVLGGGMISHFFEVDVLPMRHEMSFHILYWKT